MFVNATANVCERHGKSLNKATAEVDFKSGRNSISSRPSFLPRSGNVHSPAICSPCNNIMADKDEENDYV